MMTLITGVPGAGKTLNTIRFVDQLVGDSGRRVVVAGVQELAMPGWESATYDQVRKWQEYPDGTLFLIDEADQWAPTRGNRGEPPAYIRELARHRHRGFDFFIITQRPKMLDHHLRGLVGEHRHYERAFNRNSSRLLVWQEVQDDPKDFHARKLAITTRVNFDRRYFDKYKSAEVHTHKPKLPLKLVAVVGGFAVTIGVALVWLSDVTSRGEEMAQAIPSPVTDQEGPRTVARGTILRDGEEVAIATTEEFIQVREPRLRDVPLSAPLYDAVLEVKTYPRPQCIYSHRRDVCQCYTQQVTPLDMTYQACRNIVENGWFNPYRDESGADERIAAGAGERVAPRTAALPDQRNTPRIVYVGGNKNLPPTVIGPDDYLPQADPRPGQALRNPNAQVPVQPAQPGVRPIADL
jgi:zona occludens toxin